MNRLDRLLGYLLALQSRELVRAQELAAQFEVSERTVYRDMEALAEIGVPVVGQAGEGYRLMAGYTLPPVMFTAEEARALFLAISMLSGLTERGPTASAANSALAKVRAILPNSLRTQVEALQTVVGFYTISRSRLNLDDEKFVQLQQAINQHQVVYLYYHAQHSNRITARAVEPLRLAYVDTGWLLHGYCRLRQDYRNFRLDRVDRLEIKPEAFDPRPVNLPGKLTADQRILVRFAPEVVRWVQETQHFTFSETVETDEDGAVIMAYQVADFGQIMRWLLGWGEAMTVLEPVELRTLIATSARQLATQHAGPTLDYNALPQQSA